MTAFDASSVDFVTLKFGRHHDGSNHVFDRHGLSPHGRRETTLTVYPKNFLGALRYLLKGILLGVPQFLPLLWVRQTKRVPNSFQCISLRRCVASIQDPFCRVSMGYLPLKGPLSECRDLQRRARPDNICIVFVHWLLAQDQQLDTGCEPWVDAMSTAQDYQFVWVALETWGQLVDSQGLEACHLPA